MIHTKRFIEKVSLVEGKQGKDVVLPISEARGLRDELAKLLVDSFQKSLDKKSEPEPVIQLEMKGGSFT